MIDPPIDKLIKKTDCRYALTCAISYRARQLVTQDVDYLQKSGMKPVSLAAKEIYEDKIVIVKE
jgi:DNA-directed RNA polymerase omega subunit